MGWNPSLYRGSNDYPEDLQRPVDYVSWTDCQDFIARLNGLTGRTFRLPTEAEWEFAARGGNKSKGYIYAGSDSIGEVAWYYDNSKVSLLNPVSGYYNDVLVTHTVATKAPNELGLYDMSGNAYEWCYDCWDYYSSTPVVNPTGPERPVFGGGLGRIYRGGAQGSGPNDCRVDHRFRFDPREKSPGFRLALQMDE
jgi:formylglycine-generating enzyme required for sulfatase activity